MLLSFFTLAFLAGSCISAPVPSSYVNRRGLGDFLQRFENTTLSGIVSTAVDSIKNPGLAAARVKVAINLGQTKDALEAINEDNQNQDVAAFVDTGLGGLAKVKQAVDKIGQALLTGGDVALGDQTAVAEGTKIVQDSIQCIRQIPGLDANIKQKINSAAGQVADLREGGSKVIEEQGKSLVDLGLPDDFLDTPPDCTAVGAADA